MVSELLAAVSEMFPGMLSTIGDIVVALIVLLVGWLIGRVTGNVLRKLLKKLKVDDYFKIDKGFRISVIFPLLLSWIIYIAFIQVGIEILGVPSLSLLFGKVFSFVSSLLGGMVIIIVGYVLARYVQKQVTTNKTRYSITLGQTIFFFTMIITASIAFDIVGIPTKLINNIILILVASVGLGIAIALGLGLKDTVAEFSKKYIKKL